MIPHGSGGTRAAHVGAAASLAGLLVLLPATAVADALSLSWNPSAAEIRTECDAEVSRLAAAGSAVSRRRPSFRSTILPLENALADARDRLGVPLFLWTTTNEAAVRDASLSCRTTFANALTQLRSRPELYADAYEAAGDASIRSRYDRRLTDAWVTSLRRGGGTLSASRRAEYLRLAQQLAATQELFERNFLRETPRLDVSRRDLSGMPADLVETYAREGGSNAVPVDAGTTPFLRYANNASLRETYYLAFNRRATPENVVLLGRAIALRDRIAHLLGFESWADYRLADTVAGSRSSLQTFLHDTTGAIASAAGAQSSELRDPQPWNVARDQDRLARSSGFDPSAARRYFGARHTVDATLEVLSSFLGLRIAPQAAGAWAPGVRAFAIVDGTTQRTIATLYIDLDRRDGSDATCRTTTILPQRPGRPAAVAITAGWTAPSSHPALLDHDRVVMLFGAIGDALRSMLATVPYETLDATPDDFAATQRAFFENFAWQPAVLKRVTALDGTGPAMPDSTIGVLVQARDRTGAYDTLRLLVPATVDLVYHSSGPHVDTTAIWSRTASSLAPRFYQAGTYPQVASDALLDGWDVRLYAKPWGRVYASDLFTALPPGNALDTEAGMHYRRTIAAPAGSDDAVSEMRAFLGRDPQPIVPK